MLETISGDRIRHELELMLREALPERMLRRADELGVLAALQPSLKADAWLQAKFQTARAVYPSTEEASAMYLCLLFHRLALDEVRQLMNRLNFKSLVGRVLQGSLELEGKSAALSLPGLKPSDIYGLLNKYPLQAIQANILAQDSGVVQSRLRLYLERLRYVKIALDGCDLQQMGISPGPRLGHLLAALHKAKLDGEVNTREDEVVLMRGWLQSSGHST